jgi:hypothetical protein
VPSARYNKKFAKEVQLRPHTAKMLSQYVDVLTPSKFRFKTLHDVKIFMDHEKILAAIPEPWVDAKGYSVHSYATHKHPVNPTGLDEEALATYKIPEEAQKLSDTLAKEQGSIHACLVKLQLPAAELAKYLHSCTEPLDNPKCLSNSLRQEFGQEADEGADARTELE